MIDQQSVETMVVILTGGIASGKTAVSDEFARLGVPVIDTDIIAREVVEPGAEALDLIGQHFGQSIIRPDGSLDRSRLRQMIFEDPAAREALESLLHPRIMLEVSKRISMVSEPYCVVVIPLYAESQSTHELADTVVVIDVDPKTQVKRLIARDEIDESAALSILGAQADRESRLELADYIIPNNGSLDALRNAVADLHRVLEDKAKNQERQ